MYLYLYKNVSELVKKYSKHIANSPNKDWVVNFFKN